MREADYRVRALEVHSLYAWDFAWMKKVLEYIDRLGYNTLIVHRNDIVESLEYPGAIFGYDNTVNDKSIFDVYSQCYEKIFRNTPTRRSSIFNKSAYFRRLLKEAEKRGIDVYIENKELYFPDILPELRPELIRDGHVCPSDPYWKDYIKIKFREFFRDYPEVKGVITSIATSESKISIKNNRCHCSRCKETSPEEWYRAILKSLYEVLSEFGKVLVVRDFVFNASAQKEIATVMEELPEDVVISLKNTPHDYYPTFPINPRIGKVGNHRQWIEFDTMGQYFGMGVGIADLTEDYRKRLVDAKNKGADGAIFRTDWESFDGQSSFITPNLINVYAGAALTTNLEVDSLEIYKQFAEQENWCNGDSLLVANWLKSIYSKTWAITSRTVFADGCVFSDSSTIPISIRHGIWLAEEKNSLRDWDKSKENSISPLRSSLERVKREKDEAKEILDSIVTIADNIPSFVNEEKGLWLKTRMHVNRIYLNLFSSVVLSILYARYILSTEEKDKGYLDSVRRMYSDNLCKLHELKEQLDTLWMDTEYDEHVIYTLLDPKRVECLIDDLERSIN